MNRLVWLVVVGLSLGAQAVPKGEKVEKVEKVEKLERKRLLAVPDLLQGVWMVVAGMAGEATEPTIYKRPKAEVVMHARKAEWADAVEHLVSVDVVPTEDGEVRVVLMTRSGLMWVISDAPPVEDRPAHALYLLDVFAADGSHNGRLLFWVDQ